MLGNLFEQATPLRELAPETPAKLEAIVNRLMSKTPEERYATTDELVAQLQAVTTDSRVSPGAAPPSSTPAPPKKTVTPSAIVGRTKPAPTPAPGSEPQPEAEPAAAKAPPAGRRIPWWLGVLIGVAAGLGAAGLTWFLRG
jgi:hypothetical protein